MGRTLTPEQELARLHDAIREAHAILGDLNRAIRQAKALIATLLTDIQATVDREMAELSNHIQTANNQAAAQLNQEVDAARAEIMRQLMMTDLVLDLDSRQAILRWPTGKFDDQIPLPHPEITSKENTP